MKNKLFAKENILCALATAIIVASYGAQRIIEVALTPDKSLALILAIVYTVLLAVVLLLISKSQNTYFGILAALIGYKMMPPPVTFLAQTTPEGSTLYYLVGRIAVVLFVLLIYKLYKSQPEPHEIRSLPILAIMLCVPYFSKIANELSHYLLYKTGTMLYPYFTAFACYAAAVLIIIAVAYQSGYSSLRFTTYFECTALAINFLRQAGKIGYFISQGQHVSKSLYVWLALFVILMICSIVALKVKERKEITE